MIHDMGLRWVVTLLFAFSADVCVQAIAARRHSTANVISHSLHAIMAIAMAVMAWPGGAALPTRPPMIFFAAAALWFAASAVRHSAHRGATGYHGLMMLAMAWMYAAMGGLPVQRALQSDAAAMATMPGMDMPGMPGMDAPPGHAGHGGHSGASQAAAESANWVGLLNVSCTIGFGAAAAFWFYRLVTARLQLAQGSPQIVGLLCQLAMTLGMAIMFAAML